MSVQTQIDRISGAVQSAIAALTEKGVTVPDGTKVDGIAALIASIEAGGGGSVEPFSEIVTGTITYSDISTEFLLPKANDLRCAYFIKINYWNNIIDVPIDYTVHLLAVNAPTNLGYSSGISSSSSVYMVKGLEAFNGELNKATVADGKIKLSGRYFRGTYWYALIYGAK